VCIHPCNREANYENKHESGHTWRTCTLAPTYRQQHLSHQSELHQLHARYASERDHLSQQLAALNEQLKRADTDTKQRMNTLHKDNARLTKEVRLFFYAEIPHPNSISDTECRC
jgi:hypothetical protein